MRDESKRKELDSGTKRDVAELRLYEKGAELSYGVVLTVFTAAVSEGNPGPAMKKLWSYILR